MVICFLSCRLQMEQHFCWRMNCSLTITKASHSLCNIYMNFRLKARNEIATQYSVLCYTFCLHNGKKGFGLYRHWSQWRWWGSPEVWCMHNYHTEGELDLYGLCVYIYILNSVFFNLFYNWLVFLHIYIKLCTVMHRVLE